MSRFLKGMINFLLLFFSVISSVFFLYSTEAAERPPHAPRPRQVWKDEVSGLEFVWLPDACFRLGNRDPGRTGFYHEKPMHPVCIDGFWMGKYEVTNAQYRQFKPEHSSGQTERRSLDGDEQPVVSVSWYDAKAYTDWLSSRRGPGEKFFFRLPTEAEWEFACRGGTETVRYWGDEESACRYANVADFFYQIRRVKYHDCSDGFLVSSPVGRFPANPAGLYDMLGNVWEWCEDRYGKETYRINEKANKPKNPLYQVRENGMDYRVIRGGSWLSEPDSVRCAKRSPSPPTSKYNVLGFRVVMESVSREGYPAH